ncbi:MAG: KilA-N domain-containing protein [Bacteroidota bacterium]
MPKQHTLVIEGTEIVLYTREKDYYVSITDIARHKADRQANELVRNWLRAGSTIDFLGEWERKYNPDFNDTGYGIIRSQAVSNSFMLSTKEWTAQTNAIGLEARPGRYGGTYGHLYIALHFANWMEVSFYLQFIDGYVNMIAQLNPSLDVHRLIAKANYHIHAAAVRESLPLMAWNTKTEALHHASELDMLNLIVWGMTAKEWKQANPDKKGNLRDHANKLELVILNNLQSINAVLIEDGMKKEDRANKLLKIAATQMQVLLSTGPVKKLDEI